MQHLKYAEQEEYKICFLVNKIQKNEIENAYLSLLNLPKEDVLVLDLYKDPTKKKTSNSDMKEYLQEVYPVLEEFKVKYVVVCNSDYYKVFAKEPKAEVNIGYLKEVNGFKVAFCPDFKAIFYDPIKVRDKIGRCISAINNDLVGKYSVPGSISFNAAYPSSVDEIFSELEALKSAPALTCDIETFSLKLDKARLGSITFCKSISEGIAFQIDPSPTLRNMSVRSLLKNFLEEYQGTLIFHNISFDATILIYELWMDDITDVVGLERGMKAMLKNFDDTKIIAYLATNSCAGNELGLKALAQEFAGNYAQEEISDITKIPYDQLLDYNLRDGLATWFVYNKYYPKMVADNQKNIYENLFRPSLRDIIQMQLTGFPLSMPRVEEVEAQLIHEQQTALDSLLENQVVKGFMEVQKILWVERKNKTLKKKQVTIEDADIEFNPRSHLQLSELLYDYCKLPVLAKTSSCAPSTDSDTIGKLMKHTENEDFLKILQALLDFSAVDKILSAFIPAFKEAVYSPKQNWHYLVGSFNLGGTVSGRMSSSRPNLQQLPATGSKYAKIIKSCFIAPPGWILCGLDFSALEDHISALTTKDPNKLAVYIHGYDGHALRASSYFSDQMPDIQEELKNAKTEPEKVKIINSIKERYKKLRQASKAPTFALTYAGTWKTLVANCGFSEKVAKQIEAKYHELYKVSDEWVAKKLKQATKDGYVTCAFGLKVRTPLLKQVIKGTGKTPKEAEAEGRTAGNALGQSYCLLTNRAAIEFNNEVRNSEYKYSIRPVAHIHDAQYFLIKDEIDTILWANTHLVKAVSWQDDPAIYHPQVKLGGEFSMFWPDWAHEISIPNVCTSDQLQQIVKENI